MFKNKEKSMRIKNEEEIKLQPGNFVVVNQREFQEVYKVGKSLGNGAFGEVRRAMNRETNEMRAVKIFRKDLATTDLSKKKLMDEINILRSLDHPNIIRVFEFFEDAKRFYIVMEQCSGGELFEEILKRSNFTENLAATILYQVLSAVAYIHSKDIVHRDLKPENILLEEKGDVMNIKLIDFGTAAFIEPGKFIRGAIGTAYYIAPEVLSGSYNFKCDLWSCGVLTFILLAGYPPFDGQNDEEILSKVKKSAFGFKNAVWNTISKEAKDFIKCLLSPSSTRISAVDALSHPWMANRVKSSEISQTVVTQAVNNLRSFQKSNKLREAVQLFITTQCVSNAEVKELREVFREMDTNGDGKLSKEELFNHFVKEMGAQEAEEVVGKIMKEVDIDNNGFVDYSEFIKATIDYNKIDSDDYLKRAFKLFDKDGSGKISANELRKILAGGVLSDNKIWTEIIKQVDLNGDGEIDLEEFEKIILSKL